MPDQVLVAVVAQAAAPTPIDRAADPDGPRLDALATDLAAAGRRARSRKAQATAARPDPAFAEGLRTRLVQPAGPAQPRATAGFAGTTLLRPAPLAPGLPGDDAADGPADARPGPLTRPRTSVHAGRTARRSTSLRTWGVLGIGLVVLAVVAAGVVSGRFTPAAANRSGDAAEATLVRSGGSQALVAGTALAAGDEVRVAAGGHATLLLGSSQARLAGGADVRVNTLSTSSIQLALLAGRAYNRVVVPVGATYAIVTGPYTWTASGTAFDLGRTAAAGGGEQVVLLDLEHGVAVDGPSTHQQVAEGSAMTVLFGNPATAGTTVGPIPASVFGDPWLINNAKTDETLGYPIGALAGVALAPNDTPAATPSPSAEPTESPSASSSDGASPSPSAVPSPSPTPTPTPAATPTPTPTTSPSPSPTATATAQPGLSLSITSCPGGVLLNWSRYTGTGFVQYVTLSNTSPSLPRAYPPQAGAILVPGTDTTTRGSTSAPDPTIPVGHTLFYRTLALGAGNKVLAASDVVFGLGFAEADLNPLSIARGYVSWPHFSGPAACFTRYRIYWSPSGDPTNGSFQDVTDQLQSNIKTPSTGWVSGATYNFEVQVQRVTPSGYFVVAQTDIQAYLYP